MQADISTSTKQVTAEHLISPKNLLVLPIWFISNVKLRPSKSSAVNVPATELRPPIILDEPNCSKSMFAVEPD